MKVFGHRRPVRVNGEIIDHIDSPAGGITRKEYSVLYTKPRRIVVTLAAGDVLTFREQGRRGKWLLAVDTAFRYAVRLHAFKDAADRRMKKKGGTT